jgi:hypothetical protein
MIEKFNGITPREKRLTITALASFILYVSYIGVFAPVSGMVTESSSRLRNLEKQLSSIDGESGTAAALQKQLDELKQELKRKEEIEQAFNRQLNEPGQAESVIRLFEESAGDIRVELTRISIRADDGSRHGDKNSNKVIGKLKKSHGTGKNERSSDSELVSYTSNKIDLAYRSNYENAVEYLEKVRGLPYAISLLSVNITPEKREPASRGSGKEMILTTKIGMDIFSR